MQETATNPLWVSLICVARCLVPLLILIGISYLLKRLGLIAEPPKPPPEPKDENNHNEGGLAHGSA